MKIGVYCRVSTDEQNKNGVSLFDQEERGKEFCIKRGYEFEIFSDGGLSGELKVEERPALNILMDKILAKPKEIDGVYVVDFDRLTRDTETGFLLKKTFQEENIKLYDSNGEVNLEDESQSLLLGIKILLSSFELKKLKVRIKRSLERNVIEGKVGGGKLINYGYRKGENKLLEIDESEALVVKYIYSLCIQGLGTKKIAEKLNEEGIPTKRMIIGGFPMKMKRKGVELKDFLWKDAVIYRILTNPIYKGNRLYKGNLYPCPSIISEEEFELVKLTLVNRKNFKDTTNKYFYLLKGLIYCPNCNNRFYGRKREDLSDNQYICSSQRNSNFCGNRGINIDKLDELIWKTITNLPKDVKNLLVDNNDEYVIKLKNSIETITKQQHLLLNKKTKLIQLFTEDELGHDFIKPELEKIREKHVELTEKLRLKNIELSMLDNKSELINLLTKQINSLKKGKVDEETKQKIIRIYVKRILVKWDNVNEKHFVSIDLSLSEKTNIQIEKIFNINYKKTGCVYSVNKVEYRFRKLSPKITLTKENGLNVIKYDDNETAFGLRLNDKFYKEK
jgi:DNA invertase Pin-like site-specific DNA recombinase